MKQVKHKQYSWQSTHTITQQDTNNAGHAITKHSHHHTAGHTVGHTGHTGHSRTHRTQQDTPHTAQKGATRQRLALHARKPRDLGHRWSGSQKTSGGTSYPCCIRCLALARALVLCPASEHEWPREPRVLACSCTTALGDRLRRVVSVVGGDAPLLQTRRPPRLLPPHESCWEYVHESG